MKETMTAYGITWQQDTLIVGALIFLIMGGVMVLLGYRVGIACVLLILYYLPVTFIIHSFWDDPASVRHMQAMMFLKNMAIIGGLLILMANGSGSISLKSILATTRIGKR